MSWTVTLCAIWFLALFYALIDVEEGGQHDRNRQAEATCADTQDAASGTQAWPSSDASGAPRPGPCPVSEELPILAHRSAMFKPPQRMWQSVGGHGDFGVEAEARCLRGSMHHPHGVPSWGCTCGFYAVPSDVEAYLGYSFVDLEVLLSGDVIIHEQGYRAQYQQVLSMAIPRCHHCDGEPTGVLINNDLFVAPFCHPEFAWSPPSLLRGIYTTADYVLRSPPSMTHFMSLDDLQAMCPVPIKVQPSAKSA